VKGSSKTSHSFNLSAPLREKRRVHLVFLPLSIGLCPGFRQDRVNVHQNPGRGTAGWADPTPAWPNRAGYSIPCAVMWGSGGRGGGTAGTRGSGGLSGGVVRESGSVLRVSFVYCPYLYRCCSVPSVCCSVKLPLSRPTSFCLFLSILLCTPAGGGAATWHLCCRPQPNHNIKFGAQRGVGIMAGLSSGC